MTMANIIIVEDEADIRELLELSLGKAGYAVRACASGEEGIAQARLSLPDLMLLDLMLPGVNGLEVCRQIRAMPGAEFPVIMVTARGSESDIVAGLEMGADDYIVKPFSLPVLLARVKKALSRQGRGIEVPTQGIVIDDRRHEVMLDGEKLELTSSEFSTLKFLASHPGWVYTRSQIVKAVHGENYPVTDRSVDVMILSLRRKLGSKGKSIETVRGVGYRFEE
jgi:two-component system phosphate regulon response regulator PhoB